MPQTQSQPATNKNKDGYLLPNKNRIACMENWAMANTIEMDKGITEVFDQIGIFACICRYRIVE